MTVETIIWIILGLGIFDVVVRPIINLVISWLEYREDKDGT